MVNAASITLLTPIAAVVGFAAVIPLVALALVSRRDKRLRIALGLSGRTRLLRVRDVLAIGLLFLLLAGAASQPVVSHGRSIAARGDVEAYVLFDVSRSMLAASAPGSPTRFDRATRFALDLRPHLAGVRVGVASLTDRPLPHVFPTADRSTFSSVVTQAIGIERPPPIEQGLIRATTFQALEGLAKENFFSAGSTKRAVVVLTDGESRPFDSVPLVEELAAEAIELYFVRFWHEDERVWQPSGSPESYRPDAAAEAMLVSLSTGPRISTFRESDIGGLVAAVERFFGDGPLVEAAIDRQATPLAPWLALVGAIPLAFILVRRPR
jgi:hypothetical protein